MPPFKVSSPAVFRFLWLSLCMSGLLASTSLQGSVHQAIPTDSSADITISSWLDRLPPTGMVLMTVAITNHTTVDRSWTLNAGSNSSRSNEITSHFRISVPAGGSVSIPLVVTVGIASDGAYSNVLWQVSGPGVTGAMGAANFYSARSFSSSSGPSPYMALSSKFWEKNKSSWPAHLQPDTDASSGRSSSTSGTNPKVALVDMTEAPSDWRGYSGLSNLWLLEDEWAAASEAQRQAILAWVAAAGRLHVQLHEGATGFQVAGEPSIAAGNSMRHGLGSIEAARLEAARAGSLKAMADYSASSTERLLTSQAGDSHGLADLVQPLPLKGMMIFGFILCFGLLVGPVNLFWFARGRNRPRLFWTTPLISMGGTALLVAVMLLQDGLGGTGARTVLAVVLPRQKQMVLVQDQYSRTGVLLGHQFDLPDHEAVWLAPMPHETSSPGWKNTNGPQLDLDGIHATGGWFVSRGTQGQMLHSVRLNRGGIEFQSTPQPFVVSSLGTPLKRLYIQAAGHFWIAENVTTGQKAPLKPSSSDEFKKWLHTDAQAHAGILLRKRIDETLPAADTPWFFAEAAEPSRLSIPTLNSIRWDHDRAFVTGEWEGK